jgi:hypothetical protein
MIDAAIQSLHPRLSQTFFELVNPFLPWMCCFQDWDASILNYYAKFQQNLAASPRTQAIQ